MKLGSGPFYPPRANLAMMKYSAFGTKQRTFTTSIIVLLWVYSAFGLALKVNYLGSGILPWMTFLAIVLLLGSGAEKCKKNPELIGYDP